MSDAAPAALDAARLKYTEEPGSVEVTALDAESVTLADAAPQALAAAPRVLHPDLLGLVLTPGEVALMRMRNRLEHHAAELERWAAEHVPDTFAGLHVATGDDGAGAVVRVLFADDPELYRDELASMLPEDLRPRLVLARVEHSLRELHTREREVDRALRLPEPSR